MATEFESRVQELSADILKGGSLVLGDGFDELEVFEGYRWALREAGIGRLGFLADSALKASEAKKVTSELVFEMFADAVDMSTVTECNQIVWSELESRAAELRKITLATQQRPKLALLRVANELLRRLSQTQDPILCGRVLMLLATALPLSDSSGFNPGGKYNSENYTTIESSEQFVNDGSAPKDYTLYERFWKLQRFFSGPFVLGSLQDFKICLETTLGAFDSKPLLNMDQQDLDKSDFFPKYLTSGRLLALQWADPRLRRYVLVQTLFFLRQIALAAETSSNADLSMQVNTWRTRAVRLLNQIPPKAKEFTESIQSAIDREVVWESWKKDKCPVIEQQGTSPDSVARVGKSESYAQIQSLQLSRPLDPPKWAISKQQSLEWKDALMPETGEDEEMDDEAADDEYREDENETFLTLLSQRMADTLLPGYDFSLYDPRKDYLYCWQGLRAVRQARFDLFEKLGARGTFEDAVRVLNGMSVVDREEKPSRTVTASPDANGKNFSELASSDDIETRGDVVVVGDDVIIVTGEEDTPVAQEVTVEETLHDAGDEESARKRQRMSVGEEQVEDATTNDIQIDDVSAPVGSDEVAVTDEVPIAEDDTAMSNTEAVEPPEEANDDVVLEEVPHEQDVTGEDETL